MLNIEKLAAAVAYLLQKHDGRLNYTKLIKLIYLLDREEIKALGHSMTGDEYYALPYGPVLSGLYDLIKGSGGNDAQALWDTRFLTDGYDLVARSPDLPTGWLSRFEKRVLDELDAKFHDATYSDLIEYTHKACPEWSESNSASRKKITLADILAALGCNERQIAHIVADNEAYEREEAIIASVSDG